MTPNELRDELDARNLRPGQLASLLGRSPACVSQYLGGQRGIPDVEIEIVLRKHDRDELRESRRRIRKAAAFMRSARRELQQAQTTKAHRANGELSGDTTSPSIGVTA